MVDPLSDDYDREPLVPDKMSYGDLRARHPLLQLTQPHQFRAAVRNVVNVRATGTPKQMEAGRIWYPSVHDAVSSGVKNTHLSHWAGSGLVAAVSPSMDFDTRNIAAFKEMHGLKQQDWDALQKSHEQYKGSMPGSAPRPLDILPHLKGTSLGTTTLSNLVKAGRIYRGEDPEDVLPRRTAPKTNAFAHNIEDPSDSSRLTTDYRGHDIMANNMAPTKEWSGRGISNTNLPGRKPSRYQLTEDVWRSAAKAVGEPDATTVQAQTWLPGKSIETAAPTAGGAPRVRGAPRQGQPYIPPTLGRQFGR